MLWPLATTKHGSLQPQMNIVTLVARVGFLKSKMLTEYVNGPFAVICSLKEVFNHL